MVKAKFGDAVRSRTGVAMKNEVLCKFLCHNLCVPIQSHYKLGIAATFWGKEVASASDDIVGEPLTPDEVEAWV